MTGKREKLPRCRVLGVNTVGHRQREAVTLSRPMPPGSVMNMGNGRSPTSATASLWQLPCCVIFEMYEKLCNSE